VFGRWPWLPIAGMSAVARWVFGRDRGDLPVMKRSEMMYPQTPPLIFSRCRASGVALGVPRDVPVERGFLGRGSGARQDSPARLSHNARFASHAGPSGHVGSRRADVFGSRVGAFMPDGGDPVTGWLAGFPGTGADCDSKPVLCEGYGFALSVPRRRGACQCCGRQRGAGPRCADLCRAG